MKPLCILVLAVLPAAPKLPLAAVEKEPARLDRQAAREPGPEWPRPSREVAFVLLEGLASQCRPVPTPAEAEQRELGLDSPRSSFRILQPAEDARLVRTETSIQDKSGSYRILTWKLYRRADGRWVERGRGESTSD